MAKSKNNSLYSTFGFKLLFLTTVVALSLLGTKNLVENSNRVLGSATYLAEKGSDSGENSGSSKDSGFSGSSGGNNETQTINSSEVRPTETPGQEIRTSEFSLENLKELQVRTEGSKTRIRLDSKGGSFELENENGKLKIKAKEKDGTEVKLENESLNDINNALENEGIKVATTSGNKLRIRRGEFEAETHFPLSINPTTNTLTITTPAGVKDVAVLPDQAVKNLLENKLIDRIVSGSALENPTGIKLGLLGNNPVFQILGSDDQKLLGFMPVSIQKTSFVSTETGQVVKIDEAFVQKLLDLFSI